MILMLTNYKGLILRPYPNRQTLLECRKTIFRYIANQLGNFNCFVVNWFYLKYVQYNYINIDDDDDDDNDNNNNSNKMMITIMAIMIMIIKMIEITYQQHSYWSLASLRWRKILFPVILYAVSTISKVSKGSLWHKLWAPNTCVYIK